MSEWVSSFATFSNCRKYRFDLGRVGSEGKGVCLFVLNNPSTADRNTDDATVRRGWNYACAWGYRTMVFVNVNPFCSTDPDGALIPPEDVLKRNDDKLKMWADVADVVVGAWGAQADERFVNRALFILQRYVDVSALELCIDGTPKHILYLNKELKPIKRYPKFPPRSRRRV